MDYEPFLIGNFRFGLEEGLQPWLLPQDAWATLSNGYLRRGVLCNRNGYTEFDRMVHAIDDEAIGNLGSTNYTGTLSNIPIRAGDLSFTDGTLDITDDGDGTLSGDGTGTIVYTTGVYDITFSGVTTGAVTADYDFYPEYSIVGILPYVNLTTGDTDLMVFDEKRCAQYDTTNAKLEDVSTADTWAGGDYDFFHGCNARNYLYATNNTDQIYRWNGAAWAAFDIDIDGAGAANDVDTCLMIFYYKERLVLLRPTESGTLYPQRARWCEPADHTDWTNDGYVDCPTGDWIMTAGFVGEDLVVWFDKSTWRLRYTGDSTLPFRWERIDTSKGSFSPFSGVINGDLMIAMGSTNILETDNLKVYEIDDKIPDAFERLDQSLFDKVFSIRVPNLKQTLISYPEPDESGNTASFCYNYDDKAWSIYDYGFNVFGEFIESSSADDWDEIDYDWDDFDFAWIAASRDAGYPLILAGDASGYVWEINYGGSDDDTAIAFEAYSGRWNPYLKQGKKARFGWVDFYVDKDSDVSMTVDFYSHLNGKEVLAVTQTVTFGEADDTADRVWVRADNGSIGDFHRVKLTNSAVNETIKIHAMKIYMKPAGRLS